MKTRVSTITLLLCLGTAPSLLLGQSSGTSGKIGLVNIQEAILSTAEGRKRWLSFRRSINLAS